MVRFGSVRFGQVFLRTENRTIGSVQRLCRTPNRTIGSVRNGPVLVLKASEPEPDPFFSSFFFFLSKINLYHRTNITIVLQDCKLDVHAMRASRGRRRSRRGRGREPHEEDKGEGDARPRAMISLRCGAEATSRLCDIQAAMELSVALMRRRRHRVLALHKCRAFDVWFQFKRSHTTSGVRQQHARGSGQSEGTRRTREKMLIPI